MDILLVLIVGTLNIVCFFVGAKVGQEVSKGEPIETPTINPLKVAREHQEKKLAQMEQDRLDKILHNIEVYDGTGRGQEDVPRG